MVAALYVRYGGVYFGMDDVDPWWIGRDAREYHGPHSVVAHPPCQRWSQMNNVNAARWGYKFGEDGGCFKAALGSVRRWGGILEHPAESRAFAAFGLPRPVPGSWQSCAPGEWVTEVSQSAYGHKARKRTWLFCMGVGDPPPLDWRPVRGTHQIGGLDVTLPQLPRKERERTPIAFRDLLLSIARSARPTPLAKGETR